MKKTWKPVLALAAVVMITAGCTQTERTVSGAAIGGVGGAAVGNAVGGGTGALIGGLGGAGAGALIGRNTY
ncbi:hypothetical protein IGS74_13805 [Aureimonas sp. OT7]|uniref:YMGG-like Gly-zipper domain-containing protein n=1 Tax=Aureimonas altamirensis TaxID=370622 RepID=A0A0B1Q1G9_9HYPH|nr:MULTISPECIES: YMGG-like glycine zipper-containing protein [Aureimonas]KHJ54199.1 hypothetical protein LA66_12090 [Aureimonas altamirensis]QOG05661.1 hypothetical protein IGS74_13805 [Aureimonas sp. OT7]